VNINIKYPEPNEIIFADLLTIDNNQLQFY